LFQFYILRNSGDKGMTFWREEGNNGAFFLQKSAFFDHEGDYTG
jgi:hypothetical protein